MTDRTATAHAPGSVTVVFTPAGDDTAGTRGVSFATADGVRATVEPATTTTIRLNGERTPFEPVERLLDRLGVTASVRLHAEIPVGAGFGASGAATVATALAANAAFESSRERSDLIDASARAEVAAGTGLGDVYVQAGGGLAFDTGSGRNRRSPDTQIGYVSHGRIETAGVLDDPERMRRIRQAGEETLRAFDPTASLSTTFELARAFAADTGLVTDRVRATLDRIDEAGGVGTMAMVGETVVAVGAPDACRATTRVASRGARVTSVE